MTIYPLLHFIVFLLLIALFLYTKILPYSLRLHPKYTGVFNFFHKVFGTVLTTFRTVFKPIVIGQNLSVDTAQLLLYIILLALLQNF